MAEQTQGIQNKWLLLIGAALGIVVVLIYNMQLQAVREEQKQQTVAVVRMADSVERGEALSAAHVERAEIPVSVAESFGGRIVPWDELDIQVGKRLNQPVNRGNFLQFDYIEGMGGNKPSAKLTTGYVGYTINFDSDEAPGELLRVNDTVNLLGIFPGEDGYRTYRIISNLRVVGIGKSGQEVGPGEGGIRRYDSILVDVPPEVSLPMENIETHKIGSYRLEVNPPQQAIGKKPEINPALTEFAQKAKSPYGGRGGFGGFPRSGGGDD